jgi:hypothetical protein
MTTNGAQTRTATAYYSAKYTSISTVQTASSLAPASPSLLTPTNQAAPTISTTDDGLTTTLIVRRGITIAYTVAAATLLGTSSTVNVTKSVLQQSSAGVSVAQAKPTNTTEFLPTSMEPAATEDLTTATKSSTTTILTNDASYSATGVSTTVVIAASIVFFCIVVY